MKIDMPGGKYVVAVSGGVDSVVLLDLLRMYPDVKITVAHFDHGIREDSHLDRAHVQQLARRYQLPFVYDKGRLGDGASEAEARQARYAFLAKVRERTQADALVTAHHENDVLETAVINLLRGTGRKGLSSLTSGEGIIRPLLDVPKSEIIDYAQRHGLVWREDSTNGDSKYLRNRIRNDMLPSWSMHDRGRLLAVSRRMRTVNQEIDTLISDVMPRPGGSSAHEPTALNRQWFILLPHNVSREVMASWLRQHGVRDFDRNTLERLTVAAKTATNGKAIDIVKNHSMHVGPDHLALRVRER
ncbi:tRNA lysidine(34) synthetase TilS [Aeromicrobium sp.]|nr:tRNA lysidine(34) synthetase TilS [Candidatus Saccharibacteria bacterium]